MLCNRLQTRNFRCSSNAPETGQFTTEEAKQYHESVMKLYKPIGINIFDLTVR